MPNFELGGATGRRAGTTGALEWAAGLDRRDWVRDLIGRSTYDAIVEHQRAMVGPMVDSLPGVREARESALALAGRDLHRDRIEALLGSSGYAAILERQREMAPTFESLAAASPAIAAVRAEVDSLLEGLRGSWRESALDSLAATQWQALKDLDGVSDPDDLVRAATAIAGETAAEVPEVDDEGRDAPDESLLDWAEWAAELVDEVGAVPDLDADETRSSVPAGVVGLVAAGLWLSAMGADPARQSAVEVVTLALAYVARMSETSDVFKAVLALSTLLGTPLAVYAIHQGRRRSETKDES